jgi:hypothetical protein
MPEVKVGTTSTDQLPGSGKPWMAPPSLLPLNVQEPVTLVGESKKNSLSESSVMAMVTAGGRPRKRWFTEDSGWFRPVESASTPCWETSVSTPVVTSR